MVAGLNLKINERSRRKETDDLLDFTGSRGWSLVTFLPESFVRDLTGFVFSQNRKYLEINPVPALLNLP